MAAMKGLITKINGGANVPHFKNTAEFESVKMPAPPLVILPMQQHIGEPCRPAVIVGDKVSVGQKIRNREDFLHNL